MRWEVADDEKFQRIVARGEETAEAAWGHSVHAEPLGLEPGRWYWYRFRALGEQSVAGRTRTAPADDAQATLRFVVASCQRYDVGHYAAWRHAAAENPDFVLFLGDYIYESPSGSSAIRRHEGTVAKTLAEYRARYATYKSDPLLQAAHRAAPWLMVWDDHEVANDYANLQGQDLEPDFADPARRRLPGLLGAHALPEVGAAARPGHAHRLPPRLGRAGAHPPGRRPPVPRSAGLPQARPRRLEHDPARRLPGAGRPEAKPPRRSSRSAGWPRAGTWRGPGTCSASRR